MEGDSHFDYNTVVVSVRTEVSISDGVGDPSEVNRFRT